MSNPSRNLVMLMGNIGNDITINTTGKGVAVVNATLATTDRWRDADGELRDATEWHRLVFWERNAERLERLARKGTCIDLVGRLRSSEFMKGDVKVTKTEIYVESFQIISGWKDKPPAEQPDQQDGGRTDTPAEVRKNSRKTMKGSATNAGEGEGERPL